MLWAEALDVSGSRVLSSGFLDGTVRLLDIRNGDAPLRTSAVGNDDSGTMNEFESAAFNAAGDRVLTTSWGGEVTLWPASGEPATAVARSGSRDWLDARSSANAFGEDRHQADQRRAACVACVPKYFDALDAYPNGDTRRFGHAWSQYKTCLGKQQN